jgi:two-component system sensor histidine kinase/response regulator
MHRILVVDDNKTNQLLDRQVLDRLGYHVDIANNGDEALDACRKDTFDAILMDVQMPGLDGYQTTAMLRQLEVLRGGLRTPVIGLSARAVRGDREAALAAGMDDYLTKPINVELLKDALARWVSSSRRELEGRD